MFHAAAVAAATGPAPGLDYEMTDFHGHAMLSGKWLIGVNKAAAYAGTKPDIDQVIASLPQAKLAVGCRQRVIFDDDTPMDGFRQIPSQIHIVQARQIG